MMFAHYFLVSVLVASAFTGCALTSSRENGVGSLQVVAESSEMIWNGVAVTDDHRILVNSPRWSHATNPNVPSVAIVDAAGRLTPYPNADWNTWSPTEDPSHHFVNVNAVHLGNNPDLWVVDTGTPTFGSAPIPNGQKLVQIDLQTNTVKRLYALPPTIITDKTYTDDIRIHDHFAYITDAGNPAIIVLNLETGHAWRTLEYSAATTAKEDRPIIMDGKPITDPDGKPVLVNADPIEITPDGAYLLFGPLEGPMWHIETHFLIDDSLPDNVRAAHVEKWFDMPPTGGTAYDHGNFYFSDLATNSIRCRGADGKTTTLVQDDRLHWVDALFVKDGYLWIPVPQVDRTPLFNNGIDKVRRPIQLFRIKLP